MVEKLEVPLLKLETASEFGNDFHGFLRIDDGFRHEAALLSRYNSPMPRSAQQILDDARQLPSDERQWLAEELLIQANEEAFAALEKEYGAPEPGYDEWARTHIEEALADTSPGIPHEQVMKEMEQMIRRAKEKNLKETA